MSKIKIKKNLSDEEMFKGYVEEETFENIWDGSTVSKSSVKKTQSNEPKESLTSFFTPELQEQVAKALLEVKVELYKRGVIDYRIEVCREETSIILKAVNAVGKKKSNNSSTKK